MTPHKPASAVFSAALLLTAALATAQVECPGAAAPDTTPAGPSLVSVVKDGVAALVAGKAAGAAKLAKSPCGVGAAATTAYTITGNGARAVLNEAQVKALTTEGRIDKGLAERLAAILGTTAAAAPASAAPTAAAPAATPGSPEAAAAAAARAEKKMADSNSRVQGFLKNPFAAPRDDSNAKPAPHPTGTAGPAVASSAPADPAAVASSAPADPAASPAAPKPAPAPASAPAGLIASLKSFAVPAPEPAATPQDAAKTETSHVGKMIVGLGVTAVGVVAVTAGAGAVVTVSGAALVAGGVVYAGWQLRKALEPMSRVGDILSPKKPGAAKEKPTSR